MKWKEGGGREAGGGSSTGKWELEADPPYLSPHFPTPAGMGEQELDSDEDYSRAGRVNAMLARRWGQVAWCGEV